MKKTKLTAIIALIALVFVIGAQMYILNMNTPLCRDDYSYSYTFAVTQNKFKITNFRQVIESQINHYKVMNGRAVAHTLAQTFLMFDKKVFDLFNTAAFLALLCLITYHASRKGIRRATLIFLFAYLLIWSFTPAVGDNYFWLTGSCNYLWSIMTALICILPYSAVYKGTRECSLTSKIILAPIFFVFSFIAGATNENTSAALLTMTLLFAITLAIKDRKAPIMTLLGFVGNLCGFIFMILAPGQSVRLGNNGGIGDLSVIFDRIGYITADFLKYHKYMLVLLVILATVAVLRRVKSKELICPMIFLTGALASVYSMIFSPYFPARAWCTPTVLLALSILALADSALPDIHKRGAQIAVCIVCCMLGYLHSQSYMTAYIEVKATQTAVDNRIQAIKEYKKNGISKIELDSIYDESRFTPYDEFGDLNNDPQAWPNTAVAMYYGLDEVSKKQN